MERIGRIIDDRVKDSLKVIVPNGSVLALLHILDLRDIAECLLIAISIAHTVWRWRRDARKEK